MPKPFRGERKANIPFFKSKFKGNNDLPMFTVVIKPEIFDQLQKAEVGGYLNLYANYEDLEGGEGNKPAFTLYVKEPKATI